jgi:hypothetical protein
VATNQICFLVYRYSKTPMGKKKSKLLEGDEEEKEKGRERGKKK